MSKMAFLLVGLLFYVDSPATEPVPVRSFSLSAQARAHQTLLLGIEAVGGLETLQDLRTLTLRATGTRVPSVEGQGLAPGDPKTRLHEETLVFDLAANHFAHEVRSFRNDGSASHRRTVLKGDEAFMMDFTVGSAWPIDTSAIPSSRAALKRRLPHFLLEECLRNASTLRWLGDVTIEKRQYNVIAVVLNPGGLFTLFFDAKNHLLRGYEYVIDYPVRGDTTQEFIFTDYRSVEGLHLLPSGHVLKIGGKVWEESRYESRVNMGVDSATFSSPQEFYWRPSPRTAGITTKALADGVYLLELLPGFNLFFVEMSDGILVVEAPTRYPTAESLGGWQGPSAMSHLAIAKIKETVPGKPIRYLALTHHHGDHTGGARAFMAEGVTILTTPGNRRFFEEMAAAPHRLRPDALALHPRPPVIETFKGRRVISDGHRSVELIEISPSPHADEMVMVYLPQEKILFQGDLFFRYQDRKLWPGDYVPTIRHFAGKLKELRLEPERILGIHGDIPATVADIQKVVEAAR